MPINNKTPMASRPHIALTGCRNAGKSSLINALTGQETAIVSNVKGTTTDPVFKAMELIHFGPVVFIDTPGLDDAGDLGGQRVGRALDSLRRSDLILMVYSAAAWEEERQTIRVLMENHSGRYPNSDTAVLEVINQCDRLSAASIKAIQNSPDAPLPVSCKSGVGVETLRRRIGERIAATEPQTPILGDLLPPGSAVVMVTPIDSEAPKGRMILPQVQALRDALDHRMTAHFCREDELGGVLENLKKVDLVVTDSQAFRLVSPIVPNEIPLTGFSTLFARHKAGKENFDGLVKSAMGISSLKPGDTIAIAESCTHTVSHEDIGTVKIPKLLQKRVGGELEFRFYHGRDFPSDPAEFNLIVHCGACMTNARQLAWRLRRCREADVPLTNYGILLAELNGILERSIQIFS